MREIEQAFGSDFSAEEAAAVLVEPIQGDGGLRPVSKTFIRQLDHLCKTHGILLISDEVQQASFTAAGGSASSDPM